MCGIAGIFDSRRAADLSQLAGRLRAMMRIIEHRGPDDWGMALFAPQPDGQPDDARIAFRTSNASTLLLGHRRLSIIDLSDEARQPMQTADGALSIIFNGEIYNYLELREELAGSWNFHTQSDTEVLLAAYRRWGTGMLDRLDGMFAFALWDAPHETLLCARDPLGIKPFYYAVEDGLFAFASESNAVLAGIAARPRLDRIRTAEFLVLGMTDHDDRTCYEQVRQLPGGHLLTMQRGALNVRRFWSPDEAIEARSADVGSEIYDEVRKAVRFQLRSDVPVGSCLSGGLDSGSIAAAVGDILGDGARDYAALTLTNAGFEGDESRLASMTAAHTGLHWVPVEVDASTMLDDLKRMIAAHDQPFSTLSMFGQYAVMKRARELGMKVMLDGQGGDEVFLGYERVAQRSLVQWTARGSVARAMNEWVQLRRHASIPMLSALLANVVYARPETVLTRSRARMVPFADRDLLGAARGEIAHDMYAMGQDGVDGLQKRELLRYCLPRLLRFEDRNSMAFAVEARVPLLAKNVVAAAMRLPLESRVHGGWTKYALRRAASDHLPPEVVWNPRKRGFEVPQKKWLEAIRPWIADMLGGLPNDFPIRRDALLAAIDRGEGGAHHLWRAISVALWMRVNDVDY